MNFWELRGAIAAEFMEFGERIGADVHGNTINLGRAKAAFCYAVNKPEFWISLRSECESVEYRHTIDLFDPADLPNLFASLEAMKREKVHSPYYYKDTWIHAGFWNITYDLNR